MNIFTSPLISNWIWNQSFIYSAIHLDNHSFSFPRFCLACFWWALWPTEVAFIWFNPWVTESSPIWESTSCLPSWRRCQLTMVDNSQEYRLKYRATRSSVPLFSCTAHYRVKYFFQRPLGTKTPVSDEEVQQKNEPRQVSRGLDAPRQTRGLDVVCDIDAWKSLFFCGGPLSHDPWSTHQLVFYLLEHYHP